MNTLWLWDNLSAAITPNPNASATSGETGAVTEHLKSSQVFAELMV